MKTVAIMQPYMFPYIGYFQLMHSADVLISHDDIQFIKGGWINRNRILFNGQDRLFTLPVAKASSYEPINNRFFSPAYDAEAKKLMNIIKQGYSKAPCFNKVYPLLEEIFMNTERNVAELAAWQLEKIRDYLGINCPIYKTSEMTIPEELKCQDRVLYICEQFEASRYVNPIGGLELYDNEAFTAKGIDLRFLKTGNVVYPQFKNEFVSSLSIIDVMMFNGVPEIQNLLGQYDLIEGQ